MPGVEHETMSCRYFPAEVAVLVLLIAALKLANISNIAIIIKANVIVIVSTRERRQFRAPEKVTPT